MDQRSRRIVLIAGFEAFNAALYRQAARDVRQRCPQLELRVFSDRDLNSRPAEVEAALAGADALLASLIFDYDQVLWLKQRAAGLEICLVFECALELMALTRLGRFRINAEAPGLPKPVRSILAKFGSGREEDRLAGYISLLKVGPKLLRFIPLRQAQDLRHWLILYRYWNAGGPHNLTALVLHLGSCLWGLPVGTVPAVRETPDRGLVHPDHSGVFREPQAYLRWYHRHRPQSRTKGDAEPGWPVVGLLLYRKHVITAQPYIGQLIRAFEAAELLPLPVFINGVEAHMAVRDWMTSRDEIDAGGHSPTAVGVEVGVEGAGAGAGAGAVAVEAIVSTIGFPLVGGPAGSMEAGRREEIAQRILQAKNVPYVVAAPLLIQDIHSWTRQGIGGLQGVVLFALPELDGAIEPVPLGGLVGDRILLIPERLRRLTGRVAAWIALRHQPAAERRIAIVLYGFPPGYGAIGTAALLNVPDSLLALLQALKQQGYDVGELPASGEVLLQQIRQADALYVSQVPEGIRFEDAPITTVSRQQLATWLGPWLTRRIEAQWGPLGGGGSRGGGIRTLGDRYLLGGVQLGKVWIGVQPPLGVAGDPMRLMYERDLTPHPQYAAFYSWLQRGFRADAVLHFGMHGTLEWLPGSPLGNTRESWPDILLGHLPHLYVYAANNPSESMLAKRRGYGVLISHNVPPYGRAGLYRELLALRDLIAEYREDPERHQPLEEAILKKVSDTGLDADCARQGEPFETYAATLQAYLQMLEHRLFSSGLHTLGQPPNPTELKGYLKAYFGERLDGSPERRDEARRISELLARSTEELTNLLRGLGGEYIPPAPGGDLLRDGPGVLPTGRNIHALDPYRMPSPGAMARGRQIALQILAKHRSDNNGVNPETVAVMLWGLDAIKTRGESLGILLELVGAEPVQEATGPIVRYALRPLAELDHPRIDVLINLSGIFRDSFVNIIELLDDLLRRAAAADEPDDANFIRRHVRELERQGIDNPTARLFSNPAGDFGSLVNDRVVDSNWASGDDLGRTWAERNSYSYGRLDKGQSRPEVLRSLLGSTGRVVQQIDSIEYGLTDIQEYYANTGALKKAAEMAAGRPVKASFVESFSRDATPRDLEELLRIEYRSKLLNPRWAEAMAAMGSGGAYEISQRMTALLGWAGTSDFRDDWVYDQAADTYAFDAAMAQKLRKANPEAFRNLVGRMLEANARGLWSASPERLQQLRELDALTDAELEGVGSPHQGVGPAGGG